MTPPTLAKLWQLGRKGQTNVVRPITAAPIGRDAAGGCVLECTKPQILMARGPSGPGVEGSIVMFLPAGTE